MKKHTGFLATAVVAVLVCGQALPVSADRPEQLTPFAVMDQVIERQEVRAEIQEGFITQAQAITTAWALEVPVAEGEALLLDLEPFKIVAPDARFFIGTPSGNQPLPAPQVSLFRGHVSDQPGSMAFLAVSSTGVINGFVEPEQGNAYALGTLPEDLQTSQSILTVRQVTGFDEGDVPFCGVTEEMGLDLDMETRKMAIKQGMGCYLMRIGIDADQSFVNLFSTVLQARDYIVQIMGAVSAIYVRDNNIRMSLAFARLWPDGGEPFNVNDLSGFRQHWYNYEDTTGLNIVHMFSGTHPDDYGGVSYYSNTCDHRAYGIDGSMSGGFPAPVRYPNRDNWDFKVVAHEMGHNCRAHHTHDDYYDPHIDDCGNGTYTRGTIMSYCHTGYPGGIMNTDIRFHRRVQQEISQIVWAAGCHPRDCNGNLVDDEVDIALGTSLDANDDGIPDECQDCNANGVLDPIDIAGGMADVDGNGIPDVCEDDCNGNGLPDDYETWVGITPDDDGNNVPDVCDPDCNGNGVLDYTEINADMTRDLDRNRYLDECQDCNNNGVVDWDDAGKSGFLYVCDGGSPYLTEYHPESTAPARSWGTVSYAVAITASADGSSLFAADQQYVYRVVVATGATSVFIHPGTGGLVRPMALAVDDLGNLYVADALGNAVRRYDAFTGAPQGDFVPSGVSPLN